VQGFIASARRSRDLWFGSWMLSELSKTAARTLAARHGLSALVFPAPATADELNANSALKVANKILAVIEGELDDTPLQVEQAIRAQLATIAKGAFDRAAAYGDHAFRRTDAEAQVHDLPEIYWVAFPYTHEREYCQARAYLEALMAARKNTRHFAQPVAWARMTPKSSLDGQRESVIDETLYAQAARLGEAGGMAAQRLYRDFRARRAERLSGVDLMKRLGSADPTSSAPATESTAASATEPVAAFPSTSHVAALPIIECLRRTTEKNARIPDYAKTYALTLKTYLHTVERASARFATPVLDGYDGSILYESRLREDDYLTDAGFHAVQSARRQFLKDGLGASVEPSPYYMLLQGDGDRMGSVIDALRTPQAHRAFSQTLSHFSGLVRGVVEAFGGALVYAGGDDVLAFLPLDTGLTCARTIADIFRSLLGGFSDAEDKHPTFSAGLVIAHHLEALSQTLRLVQDAEKTAKRVEGKNALAITLSKRSGVDRTIAGHWDALTPALESFIVLVQEEQVPAGAAYDLHSLAVRLDANADPACLPIQATEVRRILERKRGQHGVRPLRDQPTLIADLLTHLSLSRSTLTPGAPAPSDPLPQDAVKQFADALVIADLLADAQSLSGRTSLRLAELRTAQLAHARWPHDATTPQGADHE